MKLILCWICNDDNMEWTCSAQTYLGIGMPRGNVVVIYLSSYHSQVSWVYVCLSQTQAGDNWCSRSIHSQCHSTERKITNVNHTVNLVDSDYFNPMGSIQKLHGYLVVLRLISVSATFLAYFSDVSPDVNCVGMTT